jgi:hypothetical protein
MTGLIFFGYRRRSRFFLPREEKDPFRADQSWSASPALGRA